MPFITFRRFRSEEEATELIALLERNRIPFLVEDDSPVFDVTFTGSALTKSVDIKLNASDFEAANALIERIEATCIEHVSPDHYLFAFSNDELIDLLNKPDEWSPFDYKLAPIILYHRGIDITDGELNWMKKKRYAQLAEPESGQGRWILFGYIFSFLGGLLGLFIGWHLSTFKKTLPNGQRVFAYSERDREHGRRIFYISCCFATLLLAVRLYFELF